MQRVKHMGIVACSYEGAALCYRTVCNEGSLVLGEHAHPEVSLHTHPLSEYMKFIRRDDWGGVASLMRSSARKLVEIGAQVLICPDNTIHRCFDEAAGEIGVPWLHIAREVASVADAEGFKTTGVFGTRYLMESDVYPVAYRSVGRRVEIPDAEDRAEINRIIFDELVYGRIKESSRDFLLTVIDRLKTRGCDSIALACTELPLIVLPDDSPLSVLDSTRILARAALKSAIE